MAASDSIGKTFYVSVGVALVCSILVSAAAVILRPIQQKNKELDRKKNVLIAGGLYSPGMDIEESFRHIHARMVDIQSGKVMTDINPDKYEPRKMAKDPKHNIRLSPKEDLAGVKRIAKLSPVYFVMENGEITKLILPIHGKGLWSTLYGFLALNRDLKTIEGITFYEHGETPGLGGEVDNPKWKKQWKGKKAFDENGALQIHVIKGKVRGSDPNAEYKIDGLSGATLTTKGVDHLVRFWLGGENGKLGFGRFLNNLKQNGFPKLGGSK